MSEEQDRKDQDVNAEEQLEELTEAVAEAAAAAEEAVEEKTAAGEEATSEAPEASAKAEDPEEESFRIQLLRLRADFENFRKRTRREKEEWTQRCLENVCTDLLTVLDHYDLGLQNSTDMSDDTRKGFELVREQLGSTLGKYGLKGLGVEQGHAFDPNLHEAITHLPSPDVDEGSVVAVTRKGYELGNRLLRPAQVVVSAGVPEEVEAGGEEG